MKLARLHATLSTALLLVSACSAELPAPADERPSTVPPLDVTLADGIAPPDAADTIEPDAEPTDLGELADGEPLDALEDTAEVCSPSETPETSCADALDNDCDGNADRADSDCWWDPAWTRRLRIDVDLAANAEPLEGFPLLVVLDATVIDYAATLDDGADLRFVAADGTVLAHEIERWDEAARSFVWVRIPRVEPGSDEDFVWLYFGNPAATATQDPTAVWRGDYLAVYHMNEPFADETTGGVVADATASARDATQYQAAGLVFETSIAGALNFGPDDFIELPAAALQPSGSAFTFEARAAVTDERNTIPVVISGGGDGRALALGWASDGDDWWMLANIGGQEYGTGLDGTFNRWTDLAVSYDGATVTFVVDGVAVSQQAASGTLAPLGPRLLLGNAPLDLRFHFDGPLDEVRFSDAARSVGWLAATQLNYRGQLVRLGAIESF